MASTVRLGRIFGIPVGINWSVLVIATLVAFVFGLGPMPQEVDPGRPDVLYLLAGVAAAVLFLASILAHELGHALVARARGIEVDGITLWLLGGVAQLRGEAASPRDDAVIALVGPAVSVAVGLCFGVLAGIVVAVTGETVSLATMVLGWLAGINVLVAVFNLLPAAPLDGGRVLRAALWARHRDRTEAALAAARAGRGLGVGLIAVGLAVLAAFGAFDGIWLMLVGWFLVAAARAEAMHATLQGVRVSDVMTRDPVVAPDWIVVRELIDDYLMSHRCSTFPLRAFDGRISGLVTMSAVKRVPAGQRDTRRARDVAVPIERVPTARPDEPLVELLGRLGGQPTEGRALVFDGDELVGVVSPADVAWAERRRMLGEGEQRRDPLINPPTISER